ncbi:hypothetical protein [Botryobacter ruber]|uniref:hypothetical protein n=1 Tax=Botryobacter ruber TaxID=2171629 RepID=UPI000F655A6F|nr:hypothetical protein [Botryobacter ruber]
MSLKIIIRSFVFARFGILKVILGAVIRGARDVENKIRFPYANLFNDHWVRPGENEEPKFADVVEGACYW